MWFIQYGPIIYDDVTEKEINELRNCYINSLDLAKENNIREIAFCSISTGEFRFPKLQASMIVIETARNYLKENTDFFEKIVFNVFTDEDYEIYSYNLKQCYCYWITVIRKLITVSKIMIFI